MKTFTDELVRGSAMAEGPRDALVSIETRVPGLSCGIICVILRLAVLIQYQSVTDTQTHDTRRRHIPRLAQRRAVKTLLMFCQRAGTSKLEPISDQ